MNEEVTYKVYIGGSDQQTHLKVLSLKDFEKNAAKYFAKRNVNFSINLANGFYISKDNDFIEEGSFCITFVGGQNFDIVKFAQGLSMYLNQECFLLTKQRTSYEYR